MCWRLTQYKRMILQAGAAGWALQRNCAWLTICINRITILNNRNHINFNRPVILITLQHTFPIIQPMLFQIENLSTAMRSPRTRAPFLTCKESCSIFRLTLTLLLARELGKKLLGGPEIGRLFWANEFLFSAIDDYMFVCPFIRSHDWNDGHSWVNQLGQSVESTNCTWSRADERN